MEREQKIFKVFLSLHAHKATATETPCAYLQFYDEHMAVDAPLIRFTREEVVECDELDHECELVRYLLHQMTTYDCRTQRIVGLVFDKEIVLSDVLRSV